MMVTSDELKYCKKTFNGITVIEFDGEMDISTRDVQRQAISDAIYEEKVQDLILDLTKVYFIDSAALGTLIKLAKVLTKDYHQIGHLRLVVVDENIKNILVKTTKLDRFMPVHGTVEDAYQAMTGREA